MNFSFFFSFFKIFINLKTSEQHTGTDLGNFVYSPTGFV